MPTSRADALATLNGILERLRADHTADARAEAAGEVGALFSTIELNEAERGIALTILEQLVGDVEYEVRHALAEQVRSCAFLPGRLARQIAEDIDEIAVPFIGASTALSDTDLIAIIGLGSSAKQIAVAGRSSVSAPVANALADTGNREVVSTLLGNEGAAISDAAYERIMHDFGRDDGVKGLMVERQALPLGVIERLIQLVTDALRDRLIQRHAVPAGLAVELVGLAGERALMDDTRNAGEAFDPGVLARRLQQTGRLTPTLLMRALFNGDLAFFESGMAMRAGVTPSDARALLADKRLVHFRTLYDEARLPPEYFRAFRAALLVFKETIAAGRPTGTPDYGQAILNRVMKDYDEACPADVEHLLSQMAHGTLGRADRHGRRLGTAPTLA